MKCVFKLLWFCFIQRLGATNELLFLKGNLSANVVLFYCALSKFCELGGHKICFFCGNLLKFNNVKKNNTTIAQLPEFIFGVRPLLLAG